MEKLPSASYPPMGIGTSFWCCDALPHQLVGIREETLESGNLFSCNWIFRLRTYVVNNIYSGPSGRKWVSGTILIVVYEWWKVRSLLCKKVRSFVSFPVNFQLKNWSSCILFRKILKLWTFSYDMKYSFTNSSSFCEALTTACMFNFSRYSCCWFHLQSMAEF